jgi:hypothetical protein
MRMGSPAQVDAFNTWAAQRGWVARCDSELQLENASLRSLLAVWREQARDRVAPLREEMTARLLKPYLINLMLIERLAPQSYLVRLMGTRVTQIIGHLQGKQITSEPAEVAARWYAVLDLTLAEQRPLRYTSMVAYPGREHLMAEALHLPLTAAAGRASSMVLIGTVFEANVR